MPDVKLKRTPSKLEVSVLQEPLLAQARNQTTTPTPSRLRKCKSTPARDCGLQKLRPSNVSSTPAFGMAAPSSPTGKAALVLLGYLATGIACFVYVKDQLRGTKTSSFIDALYFSVVTMTTVGYGDLVPATNLAKLITCMFVFVGFGICGLLLGQAANYLMEKQERLMERALRPGDTGPRAESRIRRVHCKLGVSVFLVVALFAVGLVVLMTVEGLGFVDAFYCVCVTATTLGYGDRSFSTAGGRLFAVVWILMSTVCVAQLILYVAELVTEGKQQALTKWFLSRKITYSDFQAADWDEDGAVSISEFTVYKLKEMGKLDQEDVAAIVKQFQELDVDGSGSITLADIYSAQEYQREIC